jgi:hypothetical protein
MYVCMYVCMYVAALHEYRAVDQCKKRLRAIEVGIRKRGLLQFGACTFEIESRQHVDASKAGTTIHAIHL